jgi:hypothetical protein
LSPAARADASPNEAGIERVLRRAEAIQNSGRAHVALEWVDVAQLTHDFERSSLRARDVHVHSHVVLTGHHLGRPSGAVLDPGVIERGDNVVLIQ